MIAVSNPYKISNILPANEALLLRDVYLILLHANRIPPHLAVSVKGKLFTLNVKGPMVDGELGALLKLIKQRSIAALFVKLDVPDLFTMQQLSDVMRKFTLLYPRADIGVATCLHPIRDFCSSIYDIESKNINFIYELLPKLYEQKLVSLCYQMNLDLYLKNEAFAIERYSMYDIYEGIRMARIEIGM